MRDYITLVGLSERELARQAGISHSTLNHLLTGRRTTCSEHTADAIEGALGCASGVFFSRH
jgi:transcriptional regulator with XRE-family HTH domain